MSHTLQIALVIGGLLTVAIIILARVDRRQDDSETEDGKLIDMYPNESDPERTITDDYEYPSWRKEQKN